MSPERLKCMVGRRSRKAGSFEGAKGFTIMTTLQCSVLFVLLLCGIVESVRSEGVSLNELFNNKNEEVPTFSAGSKRGLKFLVQDPQTILEYHNGPLLSGASTPVYVIWYGPFTDTLKGTVRDFFSSFNYSKAGVSSVSSWWNMTSGYKDSSGNGVSAQLKLTAEVDDSAYSLGKVLNDSDVERVVLNSVNGTFKADPQALYIVLTADDVDVNDFCMNSCAAHASTNPTATPEGKQLPYAWVANAEKQCPGKCAWPFAKAEYGPDTPALVPPNANVGADGMVINLATIIAGAMTNPFDNGFYQGDGAAPLEAATACAGSFGHGSYSGYPGELQKDQISGASYNVEGANGRKFLLPALWNAGTRVCTPP